MRKIPFDIGTLHFCGIGGIGMSGIAEVMHNLGYQVQGSDITENANVKRLKVAGVKIFIGQKKRNLEGVSAIIISSAIGPDNPEVLAAKEEMIPVVRRADMLAELMRLKWCVSVAGTHGKTTTTSMIAAMLDTGGFDPTVINGGIINAYGTNARLGAGEWMVVEADESDGSFVRLPATYAIVTNMDPEHLDFYGDFETEKEAFHTFVSGVPFYGAAILCIDHPEVQALIGQLPDHRIITYGMSQQADVRAQKVRFSKGGANFEVAISERFDGGPRTIKKLRLNMPGLHNVQNATAAVAVGLEMGMSDNQICEAFLGFSGVKRRFTLVGEVGGVSIVDDYGHHPVEIAAVLAAAREAYEGNIIAVVQPHRFTRLQNLFDEFCTAFNQADQVIVAPVYSAGEEPIPGIDQAALVTGLKRHGHRHVHRIEDETELAPLVADLTQPGDLVVCLGAGTITYWANALPDALQHIEAERRAKA